jgi:tripartite-type tricarboxylate transporter receptor subunit TctC
MAERLKQPVVTENKTGASGNIGAAEVARATPDGHTLLLVANGHMIAANLYKSVPYHAVNDFAPIALAARGKFLLVANPKTNISTVTELIEQAKARPGKINYASSGIGTPHHMAMELFKGLTNTELTHVPYKGVAGALTDVIGGQCDVMFLPIHVGMPQVRAGKLKALAVGSATRDPAAPDVVTLGEAGVTGVDVDIWIGFLAPAGTPAAVVSKLNSEVREILALPEIRASLEKQGLAASPSSPDELRALMKHDFDRWGAIIRKNNIAAE